MFCNKCQIEVEPMLDQWNNKRCPDCKQMFTVPKTSSDASVDNGSPDQNQKSESASPAYAKYLKQTNKFRDRKNK
ncbi:hypothetical protein K9N50_01465 [bacterium]|nr:hypothetical protein [bacterium]